MRLPRLQSTPDTERRQRYRLTRLAVEIYLLAILATVTPIVIVGALFYYQAQHGWLSASGLDGLTAQMLAGDLTQFRSFLVPAFLAILAFALLCAALFARRILHPLSKMLDVTKELTKRDVWGRADVRRQIRYKNLANHLQTMADDLAQQFNARETLSSIDQVILSGADSSLIVEFVLRHIVESVQCRRAMITIFGDEPTNRASTAEMTRGHPVKRSSEVEILGASRAWLAAQDGGIQLSSDAIDEAAAPFVATDTPHTFVLPIIADGRVAAAVSIMTKGVFGLNELEQGHVRDLAGRLAVALEAFSRSERLRRKAYFDDLTGLPNRDFCFARLDRAIKQAKHTESAVAVMFIDLDGFKAINDSLGHVAGDELIRQAAYRLSSCVSESGTVGRLGGDEFAVVLPFPFNSADPANLSKRLIEKMAEPFTIGSSEVHVGASIGVARFPDDGSTRAGLLRKADTAMYHAKQMGRGRSVDYSNTMGVKVDERLRIESDLRRALDNDEFELFYQPQMDMRTGRIVSAEALLRWNHPEDGIVLPDTFISIAEDAGFIPIIGRWVLANACEQLARWQDAGIDLPRVSVNVSARQFRHHDFIDDIESCLLRQLADPSSLEVELTESVFIDDLNKAHRTLEQLKATGVYVSIDDFGTGYSSLGYLKHLTFDAVKVDQSFVHELPGDRKSEAIVHAVVAMCHTLKKHVVAEGIETDSQLQFLRKAGVDVGQGFRIGRPMQATQFGAYVTQMQQRAEARSQLKTA
ncbi:MAG: EAL domain-containing protein [Gammaproteobacteria bacterium]|nr:EAL domain-containing protein [Gammaproteobacteria bacterium]